VSRIRELDVFAVVGVPGMNLMKSSYPGSRRWVFSPTAEAYTSGLHLFNNTLPAPLLVLAQSAIHTGASLLPFLVFLFLCRCWCSRYEFNEIKLSRKPPFGVFTNGRSLHKQATSIQ